MNAMGDAVIFAWLSINISVFVADERDNISTVDSDRFKSIIEEVERLHQQGIGSSFTVLRFWCIDDICNVFCF